MKKTADLEGEQAVVHPLENTITDLSNFLGQPAVDSTTTISKQNLLRGVSERTALLADPKALVVQDLEAYTICESRQIMTRLTGPLNRMFPEDKPEDAMSTLSLVCTEIYILITTCLPELS